MSYVVELVSTPVLRRNPIKYQAANNLTTDISLKLFLIFLGIRRHLSEVKPVFFTSKEPALRSKN